LRRYDLGKNYKTVFFIGIGGIHMSAMARLLHESSLRVAGSDKKSSAATDALAAIGVTVYIGHDASHITRDIDAVIYTAAVPQDNPELARARELGVETMERAKALGLIMKNYKYPICVSGTHGKTTATSMITEIFLASGRDSTAIIGGILPSIGGALRIGSDEYFIAEANEYFDDFLRFFPYVGVILNIELDHTDYFKNITAMRKSFADFARIIDPEGALVINSAIQDLDEITHGLKCKVITYGFNDADYTARNIAFDESGFASFDIIYKGAFYTRVSLSIPGEHNILNALASAAASIYASSATGGLEKSETINGLSSFSGADRRFQFKGAINGGAVKIYDDYAHHPSEIKATIDAALKIKHNKLWCIFQPHTKKRTRELFPDFVKSFAGADNIIILDIYNPAGREENDCEITSLDLLDGIKKNGQTNAYYFSSFQEAKIFFKERAVKDDMLITMGAGDVVLLGESIISG